MDKSHDAISRPSGNLWGEIGNETSYLLLEGAGSPRVFFKPDYGEKENDTTTTRSMNARRKGVGPAAFLEETRVNSLEFNYRTPDCTPGPAV